METTNKFNVSNIEDFEVGQKVQVQINDVRSISNNTKWVDGVVTGKGHIYPVGSNGERFKPYPKLKVKYIHTYYRKLKDKYDGIVWIGEEGEFYDEENEALFITRDTVKSKEA